MKCYYADIVCDGIDTSGMDKIDCQDCKHYPDNDKNVEIEEDDWDNFMMRL
jgi:hypothetical protein